MLSVTSRDCTDARKLSCSEGLVRGPWGSWFMLFLFFRIVSAVRDVPA